ncbi:MAG: hypothetical protein QXR85_02420 [Candidatus Micrarchaeaceae archaeon]
MNALITTVKHGTSDHYYALQYLPSLKCMRVLGNILFSPGEAVNVDESGNAEPAGNNEIAQKEARNAAIKNCKSMTKATACKTQILQVDEIAKKMWRKINEAAQLFLLKMQYAAPIIIRYHNDIDGASGAYAIYEATKPFLCDNIIWEMHKGIAYGAADAQTDLAIASMYESLEKPLLLITDFGTSEESNAGIKEIDNKFEVIWLDHHPIVENFEGKNMQHYINPWLFGGDSNFTAGLLTTLFACAFSEIRIEHTIQASFIGDYSEYVKPTEKAKELAVILDVATSDTHIAGSHNENLTPEAIYSIMNNEPKMREVVAYANNRIAEMLDKALSSVKVHRLSGASVYVVDFEKIRGDDERYPLPGRFSSKLMDKIEELDTGYAIVILHFGPYISLRESKNAKQKLNLLEVIEATKKRLGTEIQSGGGHMSAGSIKLADENSKKGVITALIEEIGSAFARIK